MLALVSHGKGPASSESHPEWGQQHGGTQPWVGKAHPEGPSGHQLCPTAPPWRPQVLRPRRPPSCSRGALCHLPSPGRPNTRGQSCPVPPRPTRGRQGPHTQGRDSDERRSRMPEPAQSPGVTSWPGTTLRPHPRGHKSKQTKSFRSLLRSVPCAGTSAQHGTLGTKSAQSWWLQGHGRPSQDEVSRQWRECCRPAAAGVHGPDPAAQGSPRLWGTVRAGDSLRRQSRKQRNAPLHLLLAQGPARDTLGPAASPQGPQDTSRAGVRRTCAARGVGSPGQGAGGRPSAAHVHTGGRIPGTASRYSVPTGVAKGQALTERAVLALIFL